VNGVSMPPPSDLAFKYRLRLRELPVDRAVMPVIPERAGSAISHSQQPHMNNSLTSLAVFGFLGAAVIALPGFAPQVTASETSVLAKTDRLVLPTPARNCSQQIWDDQCLHSGEALVREVRLVTARR
jgi:hypothetical protein